jgi:hypothetical protein
VSVTELRVVNVYRKKKVSQPVVDFRSTKVPGSMPRSKMDM